jgi:putative lipoic acid-binding regulatory protein
VYAIMSDSETLLEFPCEFPIKAFGLVSDDFPDKVLRIIRRQVRETDVVSAQCRHSQGGKYTAVTILITATSKNQVDAIYQDLTDSPDVIMAL